MTKYGRFIRQNWLKTFLLCMSLSLSFYLRKWHVSSNKLVLKHAHPLWMVHHVVQNWMTGVKQYPASDFIEESKTNSLDTSEVLTTRITALILEP